MSTPTNHYKLGLFVVSGFLLTLALVAFLGARSMRVAGVKYVSYFDESVTGLEVGAPVKYRGVTIGSVSSIAVAPDRRHVEVVSELTIDVVKDLGLVSGPGSTIHVPADLRAQLASTGLTGIKLVLIDFFDPELTPVPPLPFPVPQNHIPAAPSVLKNIEDSLTRTAHRIPELADDMGTILVKVNRLLDDLEDKKLPARTLATIDATNDLLVEARRKLGQVDAARLSDRAGATLDGMSRTVARTNRLLDRIESDSGVLANMERASLAVGDVARDANGLESEIDETLRDVQEAAKAIRKLADALERDPDMLLKGRSKGAK